MKLQIKSILLVLCCFILPTLAVSAVALQSNDTAIPIDLENNAKIKASDLKIWTIGTNDAIESIRTEMQSKETPVTSLSLADFNSNDELRSGVLDRTSIIVFDNEWLSQNDNQATYDFMSSSANKVGVFISVGESNLKFYEILEKAGVYTMCRDDNGSPINPASHGLPIVGFRLELTTDIDGTQHFVNCHYANGNLNDTELQENLVAFLNHDGR